MPCRVESGYDEKLYANLVRAQVQEQLNAELREENRRAAKAHLILATELRELKGIDIIDDKMRERLAEIAREGSLHNGLVPHLCGEFWRHGAWKIMDELLERKPDASDVAYLHTWWKTHDEFDKRREGREPLQR